MSVSLLEADLELAVLLDPAAAREIPDLALPVGSVARGRWVPSKELRRALCLLVVDGLILRSVERDGLRNVVLYGPDDLIDLSCPEDAESWTVRRPATLAVYNGNVVGHARRHPPLLVALLRRMQAGQREIEVLAAITRMTRVDARLVALMSHFAQRWGTVTASGICVDLPLTHDQLGNLIGARRPAVTTALSNLAVSGQLTRDQSGRWIVPAGKRFARRTPVEIAITDTQT